MAYRLAEHCDGHLLHVNGLGWHVWDGQRWTADRGGATRAVLEELRRALAESPDDRDLIGDVRKCESASGVAGVLALAAALEPLSATVGDLDADARKLNVANGTLDLRGPELMPHTPADRITKMCRGSWHLDVDSPLWTAFLDRVLPDAEVRGFVQRLVGVGLLGEVREHVPPILADVGAKSVFDKAIRWALGDYARTADSAVWRRLRVVPFNEVIPEDEQDRELDARLRLEADGIIAWAVAGYRDYLERGLDEPASVRDATDTYHRDSDAVARFIAEECVLGPAMRATTGQLHEAFARWQVADGSAPVSLRAFGLTLDRRGYPADKVSNSKRWRRGIALRPQLAEDAE